ncbi:nuclear transport factor 2 family protein [Agaribacter flavus]|uniref:Nuclear transport factor 2 family protein n=1 Tax=Agaribacter flavus TaxID=1902781 RepID=A0ABV7FTJ4_9ALTE
MTDCLTNKVTQTYWKSLPELLNPVGPNTQNLEGFDPEFIDIVDYIIRITHRIWEQKDFGLCKKYYADYCPVFTLGGYSDDVETVIQNTLKTVAAFPDRSLIGDNVVWRDLGEDGYYSSHRITSVMTNKGHSEFGSATGQTGRVTTIADCICKDNKIVYEWLMRDNSFLLKQLGIDIHDAAKHMLKVAPHPVFLEWMEQEKIRVRAMQASPHQWSSYVDAKWSSFAGNWIDTIFNQKQFSQLTQFYALNASVQWPGGRLSVGIPGIAGIFIQWLRGCPDAKATCDHVGVVEFDDETTDIAIRWSLTGTASMNNPTYKLYEGLDYFVLGASHLRVKNGLIINEWTVFDEVAILVNLMREHQKKLGLREEPKRD